MQMEQGLDTGPVLMRQETDIEAEETTGQLHDRLSQMGASLIVEALAKITQLTPVVQPDDGVTYAAKIDKVEAKLDWSWTAAEVDQHIRGLSPFPGAWVEHEGERIKLLRSRLVRGCGVPGAVLDDQLTVACGRGAVQILRLQRAGRGAQDTETFLRGLPLAKGARL